MAWRAGIKPRQQKLITGAEGYPLINNLFLKKFLIILYRYFDWRHRVTSVYNDELPVDYCVHNFGNQVIHKLRTECG